MARNLTPEEMARYWNCLPYAHSAAYVYLRSFAYNPPYVAPEEPLKTFFEDEYYPYGQGEYEAWFELSALKIVTRTFGSVTVTGIDCSVGAAPLIIQCNAIGGCYGQNPCACEGWFWRNKPPNPCI